MAGDIRLSRGVPRSHPGRRGASPGRDRTGSPSLRLRRRDARVESHVGLTIRRTVKERGPAPSPPVGVPFVAVKPPLYPDCGQPANIALAVAEHGYECRNEACAEFGQAVADHDAPPPG